MHGNSRLMEDLTKSSKCIPKCILHTFKEDLPSIFLNFFKVCVKVMIEDMVM